MKPIGKTKGKGLAFAEQCPCCMLWEANQPHRSREKLRAKKEIDEQLEEVYTDEEDGTVRLGICGCGDENC